jgi:hypothetical protein
MCINIFARNAELQAKNLHLAMVPEDSCTQAAGKGRLTHGQEGIWSADKNSIFTISLYFFTTYV